MPNIYQTLDKPLSMTLTENDAKNAEPMSIDSCIIAQAGKRYFPNCQVEVTVSTTAYLDHPGEMQVIDENNNRHVYVTTPKTNTLAVKFDRQEPIELPARIRFYRVLAKRG